MTTLAQVAPPGVSMGLGRKEGIYDSDVQVPGVAVTNLTWFSSFAGFTNSTAANPWQKQQNPVGVFTNLEGANSFLPTGYKFGAYYCRCRPHSYDDDPTLRANIAHWAEVRLLRQMMAVTVRSDQTDYMTMPMNDLASWADNERLAAVSGAGEDTFVVPTHGSNHAGRALDVNGEPWVINALEKWKINGNCPQARAGVPNFSPTIGIVVTFSFDGILVRPTN